MKAKNNKPVNRTASIINRSKMLMLSDSESEPDEEMSGDKRNGRSSKHLRLAKQKSPMCVPNWRMAQSSYSKMFAKGKRKRNSASETVVISSATAAANSNNIFAAGPSGLQSITKLDSMDIECGDQFDQESSDDDDASDDDCDDSELSDESTTECNFDGDDEQSDFYDANTHTHPPHRYRNRIYCHSRPKLEFKIPSNPSNPFWSVVDLEPHHSQAMNLWKRRRPLH